MCNIRKEHSGRTHEIGSSGSFPSLNLRSTANVDIPFECEYAEWQLYHEDNVFQSLLTCFRKTALSLTKHLLSYILTSTFYELVKIWTGKTFQNITRKFWNQSPDVTGAGWKIGMERRGDFNILFYPKDHLPRPLSCHGQYRHHSNGSISPVWPHILVGTTIWRLSMVTQYGDPVWWYSDLAFGQYCDPVL